MIMLPKHVRIRKVTHVFVDKEDNEIGRKTVDVPADYAWKVIDLKTREERFVNADDEPTDPVLTCCIFGQGKDEIYRVSIERLGMDGETFWGPKEFGR